MAERDSYGLGDPKTNFDEIRAMNVEELAEWIGWVTQDAFCYGAGLRDRMMLYPFSTIESTMAWLISLQNPLLEKQAEMISPNNLNYDPENGLTTNRRMTNADRIRSLSDDELARLLYDVERGHYGHLKKSIPRKAWLDWLKQEVEE